jgi:predicted cation transporter
MSIKSFCLFGLIFLLFFGMGMGIGFAGDSHSSTFWNPQIKNLTFALFVCLILMIVLPMTIHVVDVQLGYFFFLMGLGIVAYAISLNVVTFEKSYFVQNYMVHPEQTFKGRLKELDRLTSNIQNSRKSGASEDLQKLEEALKSHQAQLAHFLSQCLGKLNASQRQEFCGVLQELWGKTVLNTSSDFLKVELNGTLLSRDVKVEALAEQYVRASRHEGHQEDLWTLIKEPWMLLLCFFLLSVASFVFQKHIEMGVTSLSNKMKPEALIFWFVLIVGSMGSISVVVIATLGGIFFKTLSHILHRDYTISVICFSAAIGISALLTTVGEPLSLFVAKNLGEATPYLLRTFSVSVVINSLFLALVAAYFAKRAPELPLEAEEKMVKEVREAQTAKVVLDKELGEAKNAREQVEKDLKEARRAKAVMEKKLKNTKETKQVEALRTSIEALKSVEEAKERQLKLSKDKVVYQKEQKEAMQAVNQFEAEAAEALKAVEQFEEVQHDLAHELDKILHNTVKLAFFVWGLLLFGEGVKPIAAELVQHIPPYGLFFANVISAVADNALLGLLEVQYGMPQITVFILTISLAFWGVGMVPGNVCNIVLKEALHISFGKWAKYGIPLALVLCVLNFVLVLIAEKAPQLLFL